VQRKVQSFLKQAEQFVRIIEDHFVLTQEIVPDKVDQAWDVVLADFSESAAAPRLAELVGTISCVNTKWSSIIRTNCSACFKND